MPLDPEREDPLAQKQAAGTGSRHFLSEGADAAQARLAEARKRSQRWQHSAQRRRDRKRFFLLLLLLVAVLYGLWRQCGPYLMQGLGGTH